LALQIVAVSDARQRISVSGIEQHGSEEAARWQATAGQTKNAFTTKMGIDIGPLPIMLDVRVCSGYKRGADGSVAKEYGKELVPYPLQVSVWGASEHGPCMYAAIRLVTWCLSCFVSTLRAQR
jgi:hypothetical protein